MKKIGFKNFRKFVDFPLTEYGPITFLVGRNNSGKSTLVKALLLINNYFKSQSLRILDFANFDELNISTFGRIKNNTIKNDDSIILSFQIDNFEIFIQFTSNDDDKKWGKVIQFCINDFTEGYLFQITPGGTQVEKEITNLHEEKEEYINVIDKEISSLKETLETSNFSKHSFQYLAITDKINRLIKKKEDYNNLKNINEKDNSHALSYSFDLPISTDINIDEIANEVFSQIENHYDLLVEELENKTEYGIKIEEDDLFFIDEKAEQYKSGFADRHNVKKSLNNFNFLLKKSFYDYKYIPVSSVKQKALFYIKDKSNYLTEAINDYYTLGIELEPGNIAWAFTRKWMKEFEIGDDLKIIQHAGEAYEFKITSNNCEIPLADKGMGSVQAMLLILKLACIIYENQYSEITKYQSNEIITVVIEEPELNLHPALQSKLADLFLYVNQLYNKKEVERKIEFIIETHSEYLIRKTQLLVKENEFEIKPNDNPFHVIYFDKDMKQWKMNYREDGKFVEEFGNGFYDESSLLTLNLL